jgi:23S rRNA pseudouridine1911/1915/1917 synthase
MAESVINFKVDNKNAGKRLDVFLSEAIKEVSRSKIQKYIEEGRVLLNGISALKKTRLIEGDIVTFKKANLPAKLNYYPEPQNIPVNIIYEDEYILAVDKPSGLVVHPGNGNLNNTLVNALLYHIKKLSKGFLPSRPGIIHRLDKDTSGVVLVAKTDEAHFKLAELFSSRNIKKEYLGFCVGKKPEEHSYINLPLGRSKREPTKIIVRNDGKNAITEYLLIAYYCSISFVKFFPHTGRTHQIRVHSSAMGFPVVGDKIYGKRAEELKNFPVLERNFIKNIYNCFNRHALHAEKISFIHPFFKKEITITSPLPLDFMSALDIFKSKGIKINI